MTTCVLTVTPLRQIKNAMSCLRESLSKAYSSILESTKILSGIGFLAVENKAGQINGVELPKFDGFF
ncbi:MAG: hypothetical protein ACKOEV_00845, partial [Cytophagales bacterium]